MRFNLSIFNWKDTFPLLKPLVPPISYSDYKGVMGRIGILGGSVDYTGAPYYAADAALKFGADLSFVFCSQEASAPIKSYSPELMVTPFYNDINMFSEDSSVVEQEILKSIAKVKDTLPRIHTLVVGPGLGRHPNVMKAVSQILEEARAANTQ
jgi:ATP-dependent NAD(P)H-hydrate dehydratase